MLLSLIAPRALYVASADEDLWSDPRGEFLASPTLAGVRAVGRPRDRAGRDAGARTAAAVGRRGYHIRRGPHNLTPYDWERFVDFADTLWK